MKARQSESQCHTRGIRDAKAKRAMTYRHEHDLVLLLEKFGRCATGLHGLLVQQQRSLDAHVLVPHGHVIRVPARGLGRHLLAVAAEEHDEVLICGADVAADGRALDKDCRARHQESGRVSGWATTETPAETESHVLSRFTRTVPLVTLERRLGRGA